LYIGLYRGRVRNIYFTSCERDILEVLGGLIGRNARAYIW